jgi:phage major head subunit gpT-like protein
MNLTHETLEQAIIFMSNAVDDMSKRIAARPTNLYVQRSMLRKAIWILRCEHKAHMMPFTQRKATRRAKARMHASFITPRWAI